MFTRYLVPVLILMSASFGFYLMIQEDSSAKQSPDPIPVTEQISESSQEEPTLTDEQRTEMEDMTPEQKKAFLERIKNTDIVQKSGDAATKSANSNRSRSSGFGGRSRGQFGRTTAATVSVMEIQSDSWSPQLNLFGQVISFQQLDITSSVDAKILKLYVSAGARIKRGQLLIQIDDTELKIAQRQSDSKLAEIDARIRLQRLQQKSDMKNLKIEQELLDISEKSLTRYKDLNAQQLSSGTDYENALRSYQNQLMVLQNREAGLAQFNDTMAQLNAQRNDLLASRESIERNIKDTQVRAPFNGVIASTNIMEGQTAGLNSVLMTVYNDAELGLQTRIPAKWLPSLTATTDLILASGKIQNQQHNLELVELDSQAIQGSVKATFRFLNPPKVALGQHLSITANLPIIQNTFAIPASMLYENRLVFAVEDGKLVEKEVQVQGQLQVNRKTWYLISSDGLINGSSLLNTRLPNAYNGLRVNVVSDSVDDTKGAGSSAS